MNFYVKVFFSASVIAASVKPCIVKVLHIPFQNTPEPGALDLYFTFLVILPDAGAISTSAEFLLIILPDSGAISTSAVFLC